MKIKITLIALLGFSLASIAQDIIKNESTASYPSLNSRGNIFQLYQNVNQTLELGVAGANNSRRSWILSRHSSLTTYSKYYSTLHLQPDTGDKSEYRGVSIGYNASEMVGIGAHLAVNGNVGIGTLEPSNWFTGRLIQTEDIRPVFSLKSTSVLSTIQFTNSNISSSHYGEFHLNHRYDESNPNASSLAFSSYPGGVGLAMIADGNVGIGTMDTKGYKLGVKGRIVTEEVKVSSYADWSDFVFEENYRLPTLLEVEDHIRKTGHLKDIPSAEDVKKDGFFLAQMDAKLLQKIEELTLYTIEQKKKVDEQNSKIQKLEQENELLKLLSSQVVELKKRLEYLEKKK